LITGSEKKPQTKEEIDMGKRKFARGQKRIEIANIMREEGEKNRIGSIRCVPPAIVTDRSAEAGLVVTDADVALQKCQRQETAALIRLIEDNGVRQWHRMQLMDLPVPPEMFAAEMAKGDSRYVYSEDVRARPGLRRQIDLAYARRVQSALTRWKTQTDDPEKVALIHQAELIVKEAADKGKPHQQTLF